MRQVIAIQTKRDAVRNWKTVTDDELTLVEGNWFVRLLWWCIRRFTHGFSRPVEEEHFRRVEIDAKSILEAVQLSEHEIYLIYHREAKFLLIGSDVAMKLWDEATSRV